MSLKLSSHDFENGAVIPDRHAKQGGNVSPSLEWTGVPSGTKSLALIVDDPDAPSGLFVHWIIYGIAPAAHSLPEGVPAQPQLPDGARQGRNGFAGIGYGGPQPPSGTHRYYFHLYALDISPDLPSGASRRDLDNVMQGHILEEGELMGRYSFRERKSDAA